MSKDFPQTEDAYARMEEILIRPSSEVWRMHCKPLDCNVAVKIINTEKMQSEELEKMKAEIQTMKEVSHPSIISYLASFVVGQNVWLVMEMMRGGDVRALMDWTHKSGLGEGHTSSIAAAVLPAIDYIHSSGRLHRQLNSRHIYLDPENGIKIGDFSESYYLFSEGESGGYATTAIGDAFWLAPEIVMQKGYGPMADIWAFGISCLEMVCGKAPFAEIVPVAYVNALSKGVITTDSILSEAEQYAGEPFSNHFKDFLRACLAIDPANRLSAAKLEDQRWIKRAKKPETVLDLLSDIPPLAERLKILAAGRPSDNIDFDGLMHEVDRQSGAGDASEAAAAAAAAGADGDAGAASDAAAAAATAAGGGGKASPPSSSPVKGGSVSSNAQADGTGATGDASGVDGDGAQGGPGGAASSEGGNDGSSNAGAASPLSKLAGVDGAKVDADSSIHWDLDDSDEEGTTTTSQPPKKHDESTCISGAGEGVIEVHLAEGASEYVVMLRTIDGTLLNFDAPNDHQLTVMATLPPLPEVEGVTLMSPASLDVTRTIEFPQPVAHETATKQLDSQSSTLIVSFTKKSALSDKQQQA